MPINQSALTVTVRQSSGISAQLGSRTNISNTAPITLKSQSVSVSQLANLLDVDETFEANGAVPDGSTLVYDLDTDKYIVKRIESEDITSVDGGTF